MYLQGSSLKNPNNATKARATHGAGLVFEMN
jgi:hypothetical protein